MGIKARGFPIKKKDIPLPFLFPYKMRFIDFQYQFFIILELVQLGLLVDAMRIHENETQIPGMYYIQALQRYYQTHAFQLPDIKSSWSSLQTDVVSKIKNISTEQLDAIQADVIRKIKNIGTEELGPIQTIIQIWKNK